MDAEEVQSFSESAEQISSTTETSSPSHHDAESDDMYRGAEEFSRDVVNDAVAEATEATKSQMLEERKPEEKGEEKSETSARDAYDSSDDGESTEYPPASEYPALGFLSPRVLYVLYWRSPKLTGTIFTVLMSVSLALHCYTAIQVVCLALKSILVVSLAWRLLVTLKQALQKEPLTNPFQSYLETDLGAFVSERQVECFARQTRRVLISEAKCLIRLLAVEDYIDSLKFGVKLWLINILAGCWSTLSLFIVGVLLIFTLPRLYERNQAKVDEVAGKVNRHMRALFDKVSSRLPFLKKKVQ